MIFFRMNKKTRQLIDRLLFPVLIVLIVFVWNPWHFWMPNMLAMVLVAVLASLCIVFAVLFWKEEAVDERESAHIHFSGRIAFIVGALSLTVATVVQAFQHAIDPWILLTLFLMIAAKYGARLYAQSQK